MPPRVSTGDWDAVLRQIRTAWVSWYEKAKTSPDLNNARADKALEGSGVDLTICKLDGSYCVIVHSKR